MVGLNSEVFTAEVLVVGGGTGGTAAAIQAARRGAKTILVSEFPWLGGMLTSAGVAAPDGNELLAFQTGLWGAFLQALQQRQPGGLDHAWVSFFTYEPHIGAAIFAEWVQALPNLEWIVGGAPQAVLRQGNRVMGVEFETFTVQAQITLDGTELGEVLALADVPHRWGWDWQPEWQEPSAPEMPNAMTTQYPVQAPTWVAVLRDFAPAIAPPIVAPAADSQLFSAAWETWGSEAFLNYGRLPGNQFMLNWPHHGNDYGDRLSRLFESPAARQEFLQEALAHSHHFAHSIQTHLGDRYGLAPHTFPEAALGGGAYALHPYYRESRRLQGQVTVCERDILPQPQGQVAALPRDAAGHVTAIALGNYANDHHYPGYDFPLHPKSMRWGGRWTGTPFALPYGCLVPDQVEGLLVCDKNISVSHIANGATRLQPVVLNLGQAAGMAAALCGEQRCAPAELSIRLLQEALLTDPIAPAAVVPFLNLLPHDPDWLKGQRSGLNDPDTYPRDGYWRKAGGAIAYPEPAPSPQARAWEGTIIQVGEQDYQFKLMIKDMSLPHPLQLVTLHPTVDRQLAEFAGKRAIALGQINLSGGWLRVEALDLTKP
jgi:hypothetical protein